MPTYEYRCERGHEFEVEQRITDEPVTECQHVTFDAATVRTPVLGLRCHAKVKRLISRGTTFRLEGGVWSSSGYGG